MRLNNLCLLLAIHQSCASKQYKNNTTTKKSSKIERFREWLKWDAECNFLPIAEQEIRASQGRCPPDSSTISTSVPATTMTKKRAWWRRKKKPSKMERLMRKKQKLLSIFSAGGQTSFEIDLNKEHKDYTIQQGSKLIMTCDGEEHGEYNSTEVVSWYVNTNLIEVGLIDWRVLIGDKQQLVIWPVQLEDAGQFECTVNGLHGASGIVEVITRKEAVLAGLENYFIVMTIFLIFSLFAVCYVRNSGTNQPKKTNKQDRLVAFLEKQIMESRSAAKENIAKIVHGEAFEKRKKAVEQSVISRIGEDGRPSRGNKDTIMTILARPDGEPTAVIT